MPNRSFRRRAAAKSGRRSPLRPARGIFEVLEPRWTLSVSVLTYHNDLASSGLNAAETVLTPANVNTTSFGKLFATPLDGQVYAQPLVDPQVTIAAGPNTAAAAAGVHDVVFAATEHDSLYAIDASPIDAGAILWQRSFLNIAAGYTGSSPGSNINNTLAATSITTVPSADVGTDDIAPEIGITSTPVIDPATGTIYVVVKSEETIGGAAHYVQRLHAINIADGTDAAVPFLIGDTTAGNTNNTPIYVYGSGEGAVTDPYNGTGNDVVQFNALRGNQRSALRLENGVVYVAWASHGDNEPYHGWIVGFNVANLASSGITLAGVFNASPNGGEAGIWQSGGGLVFEPDGSAFYFATGNGPGGHGSPVINSSGFPADGSYYDAVVKLVADPTTTPTNQGLNGWGFKVADYFMAYDQVQLDNSDLDLGSGGPLLLPDSAGIPGHPHLLVEGSKDGKLYLIDRDTGKMGEYHAASDDVLNAVPDGSGHNTPPDVLASVFVTPTYFNGKIYTGGASANLATAFAIGSNGTLTAVSATATTAGPEPGSPSISANGAAGGILWQMDRNTNELQAYSAANLAVELWNSGQRAGDNLGSVVKFAAPTIANGEVLVGTGNSLVVYGAASLTNTVIVSSVVVVEATPQNGLLESNEQGKITWAATATNPIASATLTIDGRAITPVGGPYTPVGGNFFFSSVFGPLAAGTHSYVIRVTNNKGTVGTSSGTFSVASAPPALSRIAVAAATPPKDVLQANETGVISWALADGNAITSQSLVVDGLTISPIRGPFGPANGSFFYMGSLGALLAGSHSYTITVADAAGLSNSASGTFDVAPLPTPAISLVVVAEATLQNGILESDDRLKITWKATSANGIAAQTMTVDGRRLTPIAGPYSGMYYSCAIGAWSAGEHTYVISTTDTKGASSSQSGTFTVAASAAVPPSITLVAVAAASGSGTLTSSDPLRITWAASSSNGIAAESVTVDGRAIAPVNGPYSGLYYSCPIGSWSPGAHVYAITSTDKSGISSTVSDTFSVTASAAVPVTIDSIVVAEAAAINNGTLDSSETLEITWMASSSDGISSQSLSIDGQTVTPIKGPFSKLYYATHIGAWSAGTHTYVITSTSAAGFTANCSGTFSVVAA